MSVPVPAWPFPFHISQSGDKLSIQGEWHFIYSVASFTRCVSSISPIHSFVCLSSPGRNITTHPLLSLSSALPKDTVHEIRDCLQWSDRDRVAGGHILLLWFAGSSGYVIRIQLRLKKVCLQFLRLWVHMLSSFSTTCHRICDSWSHQSIVLKHLNVHHRKTDKSENKELQF